MKKRFVFVLMLIITLLFCACEKGSDQQLNVNLLKNPGFEAGVGTEIEGWALDRYDTASPIEYYTVLEDPSAPEGKNIAKIENTTFNDARFTQAVKVEPDSYYCLSAMVKTEVIGQRSTDSGAHIGFLQTHCKSSYVKSNKEWTKLTVYGKTDSKTETTTIALRLGDYSADALGVVYFDDVSLTRIEKLPDGVSALSMTPFSFAQPDEEEKVTKTETELDKVEKKTMINVSVAGILLFAALFLFLFWAYKELNFKMRDLYIFAAIALVIRLVAAVIYKGFEVDIGCFSSWGATMADRGITGFYTENMFCDYPPLYMIVLGIISSIGNLFSLNLQEGIGLALLKSPAIICDIIASIMIAIIAKKHVGEKLAVILGIGYALLPTAIVNSAVWGQVDSVLVLFMLITFWLIDIDQFGFSVLSFAVGMLFKPQAILFGPVMLLAAIHEFYVIYLDFRNKNKESGTMRLIKGFGGLLLSIGLFVLLSVIMRNGQNPVSVELGGKTIEVDWLLGKYLTTLGSYDYATLSSFGLMGLLDGQWIPSTTEVFKGITYGDLGTALLWIVGILVAGVFGYLLYQAISNRNAVKGNKTIYSGWFWLLSALMVAGAVTVSTRTHERYMFPVIIMVLISFVHFKDIRLLIVSAGYSVVHFINVAGLLFLYEGTKKYSSGGVGRYFDNSSGSFLENLFSKTAEVKPSEVIFVIGSLLTVILFIYQVYVTIAIMLDKNKRAGAEGMEIKNIPAKKNVQNKGAAVKKPTALSKLLARRDYKLPKVTWKDIVICLVITVVYGCVAFTDLGDVKAAQTYWYADKSEVYAIADLGEVKEFDSIKYLSNSSSGAVKVYTSENGEDYSLYQNTVLENSGGWKQLGESGKARYVKIEATSQAVINELVILKDDVPLEIKATDKKVVPADIENGDPQSLFDDQGAYNAENEKNSTPVSGWQSGGNYIVTFKEPISFYGVDAYVSAASDITIAIPEQTVNEETGEVFETGQWTDVLAIGSMEEGWETGALVVTDEYLEKVNKILIRNNNKTRVMELHLLSEQEINISSVLDENGQIVSKENDVWNCFDEKHTSPADMTVSSGNAWRITTVADYVIADFGEVKDISKGYYRASLSEGSFEVYFSDDGQNWVMQNTLSVEKSNLYYWHHLSVSGMARYVLIAAESPYLKLIEVGFFESSDAEAPIEIKEIIASNTTESGGNKLFDEQDLVPLEGATYMNSTYFDEIYHARTAYESANGHSIYEWTHPPLGKDFMSWCISIMGMTPFAWRFAGTVAGILMVPAMYFLGLLMFKKTSWATATALLMAFDGMHYVQTRIATIDSFGVLFIILMFLFMFWYYSLSFYNTPLKKTFIPLGLCGLSFGLGAASKWICLYAGAGLAIIFFMTIFRRWSEYNVAVNNVKKATGEEKKYLMHVIDSFYKNTAYTILFCIGVFIIIPLIIYCASYYPYWNAEGETRKWYEIILSNQEAMFSYHANLEATHPYQSDWYTWPVMETPMFYYAGPQDADNMSAIYAFGNPIVWYAGLISTVLGVGIALSRLFENGVKTSRNTLEATGIFGLFGAGDENDQDFKERDTRTLIFLILGLACNLVPWIGINRCIFIYHYFASVPFIILFTVYVLRHLARKDVKIGAIVTVVLLIAAVVVFFMFRPIWTGTTVSREYVGTWLRWQKSWFGYYFPQG